ncbi:hypothetical protein [Nocardioides nematodiphilus]|uniref:hypothetical protein n=1 Tax=Nocardioides nematodiphilus TaxID=2849669 RepID=UPI001CD92583|nr:hypothetical protein [Nocardioides nematodiphilus]MCA1981642.1 hypothetical protein [Nocardioides nematodiphilus]
MAQRYVDLGPDARDARGLLVVVPGQGYHPDKPLLAIAAEAAVDAGWRVRQLWWRPPASVTSDWAGAELVAAVADADAGDLPVRVLAKSLGSLTAPVAAAAAYPSCWLTPLLGRPDVVEGIAANAARQLLVGGTADDHWISSVARSLPGEIVELPRADHSLTVTGGWCARQATAGAHAAFIRAFAIWLG